MTKWVMPVAKAGGILSVGALVVVIGLGALQTQSTPAQQVPADTAFQAPVDVDTAGLPGPRQPIFYRHDVHAGQYQMDCRYCHAYAEVSTSPGLPSLASCMGCHFVVGSGNPEVQKLRDAFASGVPPQWNEVHRLAPFVHFPHMRHVISAELTCQECHGEIQRMPQVYRFASLKMGWCVSCHEKSTYAEFPDRQVTTDCTACHY
ncbi:MAG TPA: cytochrome c3 family protein [Gemmatimonadales bacterium]